MRGDSKGNMKLLFGSLRNFFVVCLIHKKNIYMRMMSEFLSILVLLLLFSYRISIIRGPIFF